MSLIAMKQTEEKLIQDVIKSLNWNRISYFHRVFGIKWQFQEKEGAIEERFPTTSDLKEELKTLLNYVISKNTPVLEYGSWIIFWTNEETSRKQGSEGARLEAIFSLENAISIDSSTEDKNAIEDIRFSLEEAIAREDYEKAAKLRDRIAAIEKRKKI